MPSIRARIDQALDIIASLVRLAHRIIIVLIIALALLLSLLFFFIYPLAIIPVLLLAIVAILYVNAKKDAISELIEDADEETAVPQPRQQHPSHARELAKRIILRVLDQVLSSASDTAMLAPLACVAFAVLAFVFGYNTAGAIASVIAAFVLLIVSGACYLVKYLSHRWVDRLFDAREDHPPKNETTPLLQPRKP